MKKLKFLPGGQPFRSTDFELLQNANLTGMHQLLNAATAVPVILSGVDFDFSIEYSPAESFTIPDGYIYDLSEVCRVPGATFAHDSAKTLYLRRAEVETSERLVGSSYQNVFVEVLYNLVYVSASALGDIRLSDLQKLKFLSDSAITLRQNAHGIELNSGYTANAGSGLYTLQNQANDRMVICYFTATSSTGTLANLPADMRPAFDQVGWFRSGNVISPLTIRTNGNIELVGAATSGNNYLMFSYKVGQTLSI